MTSLNRITICLVACCGEKTAESAMAQDLYVSPLFRKSRAWAEAHCDLWFILSAKHGLLEPRQVIEPYDLTLAHLGGADYLAWARRVNRALHLRFAPLISRGLRPYVFALAGRLYLSALELGKPFGTPIEFNLPFGRRLPIGKLMKALAEAT